MRKTIVFLGFMMAVAMSALAVFADAAAGGPDDPLVTLSYINQVLRPQIEAGVINKLASGGVDTGGSPSAPSSGAGYVVVEMKKNQILLSTNTLELIVRPGSGAVVVSPSNILGLIDSTDGAELTAGKAAAVNHNLIVPRPDGRGIKITTDIAYIMVRGEYEIVG